MTIHILEPERATLHGRFSPSFAPVLEIEPGDTVRYRTLDVAWGLEPPTSPTAPRRKFEPRDPERDDGPALVGPVAIRGARPGMTLALEIDVVRPAAWGWTYAGGGAGPLDAVLGLAEAPREQLRWQLDADAGIGRDQYGHTVYLRPFLGTIGMPPPEPGLHPVWPPRQWGGNMDCRELVAGSTLYLPIPVPGGLVSVGDGHALQGDGEVAGMAIECPMERVDLRFTLREDFPIAAPCAHTPVGWVTLGFHEDLDQAVIVALNGMLDLIEREHHLARTSAMALASLLVDLRVTQVVNGVRGIHAVLPHGALQRYTS
jgi:acetamidase/formamidase